MQKVVVADNTRIKYTTLSSQIQVYPNPVKDIVYISSNRGEIENILLMDISGKVIPGIELNQSGKTLQSFDISGIENGIYIINIVTNQLTKSFTFTKQ
jgi:hypothetical protein